MTHTIRGVFLGALLILLAYASAWLPGGAPAWGVWVMIFGSALCVSATTAMGAINSQVRPARAALAGIFLLVLIVVGFGAPMFLPVETAASPLVLGLPLRAAIEIYGVGLLPILILPVLFAIEFKSEGLDDAALAELRRRCSEARAR